MKLLVKHFVRTTEEYQLNIFLILIEVYKFHLADDKSDQLFALDLDFHQENISLCLIALQSKNSEQSIVALILANQIVKLELTVALFLEQTSFTKVTKILLKSRQNELKVGFAQLILAMLKTSHGNQVAHKLLGDNLFDLILECLSSSDTILFVEWV